MDKICNRREFCQYIGEGAAALTFMSTATNANSLLGKLAQSPVPVQLDITASAYAALSTVQGAVKIPDPNDSSKPAIICRTGAATVSAVSSKCTHKGCETEMPQSGTITCLCHGSQFNLNGDVLKGPATVPLKKYSASISGNIITVNFSGSNTETQPVSRTTESFHVMKNGTRVTIAFREKNDTPIHVRVTNSQGKQVHSARYESSPAVWDARGLPEGEYFIAISSSDKSLHSDVTLVLP
jgi:Rieske Fe-S protein